MQFASAAGAGNQPFRTEDHDYDENNAEDQVTDIAERKARDDLCNGIMDKVHDVCWVRGPGVELCQNEFIDGIDDNRADNDAGDAANAADDDHREINHGIAKAEVIRRDAAKLGGVIRASDT